MNVRDGLMIVGICEDNEYDRRLIERECRLDCSENGISIEVVSFDSGKALLRYSFDIDILLLDIDMPDVNGIDIKEQYQKENKETLIIFVTDHKECMSSAFGVNVYGFVEKSKIYTLKDILTSAIGYKNRGIWIGDVNSREVMYIISEEQYIRLYLKDGRNVLLDMCISVMEEKLENTDFVKVHRSYIVNMDYVKEISRDNKIVVRDKEISIAVRRVKKVKERYRDYCKKNGRYC